MLEQPNLIKRPILVLEGSPGQRPEGVIFGFDRARYERL